MLERTLIFLTLSLLATPAVAADASRYAGKWKRTSMNLRVTVESWGENCGPKPQSYSSKRIRPVEVVAQGNHLIFSKGGVRTNRCFSPNPRLQKTGEKAVPGNWSLTCETSANDPKYERGQYSLKAIGGDKLEYRAKSRYNWTLQGDHCSARTDEVRVYVRDEPETEPSGGSGSGGGSGGSVREKDPACEQHGPPKRLSITPREAQIGPGERICFKAQGIDRDGCRFPVIASWTASQGGKPVGGLLSGGGCFSAGATAADAEGEYTVTAKAEGKQGTATVSVVFPDLGDLLAARLQPLDEPQPGAPAPAPGGAPAAPSVAPTVPPGTPPGQAAPVVADQGLGTLVIVLIAVIIVLVIATAIIVLVMLRRRGASREPYDDDDWDDAPSRGRAAARRKPRARKYCPACGQEFPLEARFCPHDARELILEGDTENGDNTEDDGVGMVCPKCHRGYDPGAKFCPHDSERLVPYPEWRGRTRLD